LEAHGDYSGIANCRAKILSIFRGNLDIFSGIAEIFIYFTISRKTPNDVTRIPGEETLF